MYMRRCRRGRSKIPHRAKRQTRTLPSSRRFHITRTRARSTMVSLRRRRQRGHRRGWIRQRPPPTLMKPAPRRKRTRRRDTRAHSALARTGYRQPSPTPESSSRRQRGSRRDEVCRARRCTCHIPTPPTASSTTLPIAQVPRSCPARCRYSTSSSCETGCRDGNDRPFPQPPPSTARDRASTQRPLPPRCHLRRRPIRTQPQPNERTSTHALR